MSFTREAFDLIIIGGGINGASIARDAAGRGLRVMVVEKGDIASGTSSASTKLIHGGLRYLEHYEFGLVRKALKEREVILRAAPHIVWPLTFILPHHPALRPVWMIKLGLWLYDHLGGRELLPESRHIDLREHMAGSALQEQFTEGFSYADCWVQDARLVVLNLMDAAEHGAVVCTRSEVVRAFRDDGMWKVDIADKNGKYRAEGKILVNAAGPWAGKVLEKVVSSSSPHPQETSKPGEGSLRLVKGSHIVVPKLFSHPYPYIFQHADKRVIFALPYENDYTLIGTTDVDYLGDPSDAVITEAEETYLCDAVNQYFKTSITRDSILWRYSGVRPLYGDSTANASNASRDYVLAWDAPKNQPPLLSVFGGKITTYRTLAEEAMRYIAPDSERWTASAPLPGGDIPQGDIPAFTKELQTRYPFLSDTLAVHYVKHYGTLAFRFLNGSQSLEDLGECYGKELYAKELQYLIEHEWAETAEDVLFRRTKWGLKLSDAEKARVEEVMGGDTVILSDPTRRGVEVKDLSIHEVR
jgi:glycerol-3-phosphate dehydrogenase